MRKITSFILLICLFFTVLGYHFIYPLCINRAKLEMKKELLSGSNKFLLELSLDSIAVTEMEWENSDEFRYQGEMYDLIDQHTEKGKTVFRCLADKKETALVEAYLKTEQQKSTHDKPIHALFQLITDPFLNAPVVLPQNPKSERQLSFIDFSSPILSSYSLVFSPPPETAC